MYSGAYYDGYINGRYQGDQEMLQGGYDEATQARQNLEIHPLCRDNIVLNCFRGNCEQLVPAVCAKKSYK